jgi:hypothetical protein
VPFRITKEMRRMAEAEQGFSKEVRIAQFREMAERMRWDLYRPLRRALRLRLPWGNAEVDEKFRPSAANFLYLLAEETRTGNYSDYERFLHYLGFDVSGDTVAALDERLRVTFQPSGNNRREWWTEPSHEAAEWLRRQIAKKPRSENFAELNADLIEPKNRNLDKRKFLEPELREFLLREDLYANLPRRQAEIMWLHVELHDKDRPRGETTKAIAEFLQISPATVRWHKAEALKNPQFKKMLGLP